MEIPTIEAVLPYWKRIRERTIRVASCIPPEQIEWRPGEGRFSFGDLLRHLGATERHMFAENAHRRPSRYPGHGLELAEGCNAVMDYIARMHTEAVELFRTADPGGSPGTVHDAGRRYDSGLEVAPGDGGTRGPPSGADLPDAWINRNRDASSLRPHVRGSIYQQHPRPGSMTGTDRRVCPTLETVPQYPTALPPRRGSDHPSNVPPGITRIAWTSPDIPPVKYASGAPGGRSVTS